jgi:hypothetical protein
MRRTLLLGIFPLLSGLALAQPVPPTGPPPVKALGVLTIDASGHWDTDSQAYWQAPQGSGAISDPKILLRSEVVSRLSYEQRKTLLNQPSRLLASDRAREIFAVDRVLLLEPAVDDRVVAHYQDLQTGWNKRLLSKANQTADDGRKELVDTASNPYGPNSVAVFANPDSRLYHQMDSEHVSTTIRREDYPSLYLAESKGYRPCAICFAGTNRALGQDALERELGRVLSAQMEQEYRVSNDQARIERVNRVGHELLVRNRTSDQGYRFVVLESDEINAFAVPTGPLYITTGLLNIVESDAELAGIMGHELAHSELHHGRRQYEQMQRLSWLSLLATIATGSRWVYTATSFLGTLWNRGYSREFELEADRQGLWYSYGAGYEAQDFRLTLHKFMDLEKNRKAGGGLGWLRTHPASEDRISGVNQILDRLEPLGLVMEELEPVDEGLASYLKVHGSEFLENPVEVVEFLTAYRLLQLPDSTPKASAPGLPGPVLKPLPDLR